MFKNGRKLSTENSFIKERFLKGIIMKKSLIILLAGIIIFSFGGCGNEETQLQKAQNKIVEIGEQFLDYELTADEADEKLDSILVPTGEGMGFSSLERDKSYLSFLIIKSKNGNATFTEIEEEIKHIKESDYEYLNEITTKNT